MPRLTTGLRMGGAVPSGPAGRQTTGGPDFVSRREQSEMTREAARQNNTPLGRRSGGGGRKGSAGKRSGVGRASSSTSALGPIPKGPGGASFTAVRLPNRTAQRSPTQNARRSIWSKIGGKLRGARAAFGF
jgi:hypothetical protein